MGRLEVVYRKPYERLYKAPALSSAHFWRIFSNTFVVVLTLFLTFTSQGLWRKTNTYLEQPSIEFTRRCFLLLEDSSVEPPNHLYWNSFAEQGTPLDGTKLLLPTIESRARDHNRDDIIDEIGIRITVNLPKKGKSDALRITSFSYLLEFRVQLGLRALIDMSSLVFDREEHSHGGAKAFTAYGQLKVEQKQPLPPYGKDYVETIERSRHTYNSHYAKAGFDSGLMDDNNIPTSKADAQSPEEFFRSARIAMTRENVSLTVASQLTEWHRESVGNSEENSDTRSFTANFHFTIREQSLVYRADVFELLKWAWIQILAIGVIVRYSVHSLSSFLYENHILSTVVVERMAKKD